MPHIAVLGTGYVGLTTGACLASLGHVVTCIDIDVDKIARLQTGSVPILEDGLAELVLTGIDSSRLHFSSDVPGSVGDKSFVFLCLPTPQDEDGSADLSFVMSALDDVRDCLSPNTIVVNKSTVPVGTAKIVKDRLSRDDLSVVSNPEFLRQGTAVKDFLHPHRIVIGGEDEAAVSAVAALYEGLECPILLMNSASAEMLKYAANSMLATKLTFINAIADICEAVGADIFDVAHGVSLDPRIGSGMLSAGPGWGGSCFPKDTRALLSIASDGGYDFSLLRGVIETNDQHYERIVRKVHKACGGAVTGKKVAAWGLTFKAGTDDLRDSPGIKILRRLLEDGARISAFDPAARLDRPEIEWLGVGTSAQNVCEGADVLVLLTEWPQFKMIDPNVIAPLMPGRYVVDARNLLDVSRWTAAGFQVEGVGR